MNNPGIDTQSLVNIANRNFQTGKIISNPYKIHRIFK